MNVDRYLILARIGRLSKRVIAATMWQGARAFSKGFTLSALKRVNPLTSGL